MLGHGLWGDRVPRFVIDSDTSVKLAEQIVPFAPVLLQLGILRSLQILVPITLRSVVPVEVLFVRLEIHFGVLDYNHNIFVTNLQMDLV